MIFLTVGTQEPFDRLVRAVDDWCGARGAKVFGQLGALSPGSYRPKNFDWVTFMEADAYQERVQKAPLLVGHAGMGSIFAALTHAKPLVMCPRRADLGEHRNDHQLSTAEKFGNRPGIYLAWTEDEVAGLLDKGSALGADTVPAVAQPELLDKLRAFASQAKGHRRRKS